MYRLEAYRITALARQLLALRRRTQDDRTLSVIFEPADRLTILRSERKATHRKRPFAGPSCRSAALVSLLNQLLRDGFRTLSRDRTRLRLPRRCGCHNLRQ